MEREGKTYCDKHPSVQTALRCSRCEAYICTDCAVLTPVGYRCPTCGREKSATHTLSPAQWVGGIVVAFALGFAATALVQQIRIGFFLIFAGAVCGAFVGQAVSRVIGRKSSTVIGGIGALGFITGAAWMPLKLIAEGAVMSPGEAMNLMLGDPWPLVFACVGASVCWVQLK